MIATVTLNASIDKAYELDAPLAPGTVMRVKRCIDTAGGKGLNAARAIATCGEDVLATGFAGGHNGDLLCDLLENDGIPQEFVHTNSETRCCANVLDPDGTSTEFLEPGREVTPDEIKKIEERIALVAERADVVTFNGSLPQGMGAGAYANLVRIVKDAGKVCILDTSGESLKLGVAAKPDMIKPNTDEIAQILGRPVSSIEDVVAAAKELHDTGISRVVVSLGADGAVMACDDGVLRGTSPKIEVVNPVGSGDTMVGAFAVAIARGLGCKEELRYAMACASANCLSATTGTFDLRDAERLLAETTVELVG